MSMDQAHEDYSEPETSRRTHRFTLRDLAVIGLCLMATVLMFVVFLVVLGLAVFARRA